MRAIAGDLVKSAKFHHPAAIIASGSSGTGKTTMALNLVKNQHFTKQIKNVYYFGCPGSKPERLDWHSILKNVSVRYSEGLPTESFFTTVKKNSFIVIDDQYDDAVEDPVISRAFKVYRHHMKFSIMLITQSIFQGGKLAKGIRNNCQLFFLFKNYGDQKTNSTFTSRLELKKRYKEALQEVSKVKYGYVLINTSEEVAHDSLRVGFNIFGEFSEFGPFPLYIGE